MEGSGISWTDNTHNEWLICTKVSAGCDNCYAEPLVVTRMGRGEWGKGKPRALTSEANRRKPFAWNRQAEKEGRRIKVFTASLSDVFDEEVPDAWRNGLFDTIRATPHLDWLVLTKRLAKMRRYVGDMVEWRELPPNVWWGCSVENQPTADQRIPELLKLRALVGDAPLWLSVEPLIGGVDLEKISLGCGHTPLHCACSAPCDHAKVDWVIVGGESGPGARPMHPDWARSLRDQCVAAGVAFHFKQWGEWAPGKEHPGAITRGPNTVNWSAAGKDNPFAKSGVCMVKVGKKAAGRILDGREWNEFPR
jgi:protein gp37